MAEANIAPAKPLSSQEAMSRVLERSYRLIGLLNGARALFADNELIASSDPGWSINEILKVAAEEIDAIHNLAAGDFPAASN